MQQLKLIGLWGQSLEVISSDGNRKMTASSFAPDHVFFFSPRGVYFSVCLRLVYYFYLQPLKYHTAFKFDMPRYAVYQSIVMVVTNN